MNLQKFCPKCGKETDELFDGLCKDCYKKENSLVELPEEKEIIVCGMCGRWKDQGEWKKGNFEEFLKDKVREEIERKGNIENEQIKLREMDSGFRATIEVKGKWEGEIEYNDNDSIELNFKKETCKYCGRRESGYHESVIQIRNGDKERMEKIIQIIKNTVNRSDDKMGFISNVERKDGGMNLYIGSKSLGKQIAKNIQKKFDLERKDTYSLITRKEGEEVYRDTILLSLN